MEENTNWSKIISTRIKQVRHDSDMTQEQMAEVLNVARSTVANWEAGTRGMNTNEMLNFCRVFAVTSDYMCGRSNDKNKVAIEGYDVDWSKMSPLGRWLLNEIYKFFARTVPLCSMKSFLYENKNR